MSVSQLPAGVANGTVIEIVPGVFYQYDAALRCWIELSTNHQAALATPYNPGLMSSVDFRKLNRLVIPPLVTTITAENCNTIFGSGQINLSSLDDLITVNGTRNVAGRADLPFHIHQRTYGFDFGLNIINLLAELKRRGQLVLTGPAGKKGPKGRKGSPGVPQTLSGPKGPTGPPGDSPPCTLQLLPETYQAKPIDDLKRVIVSLAVEADPSDPFRYTMVAERQEVGIPESPAGMLKVGSDSSSWVLALTSIGGAAQPIYCVDVDPLLDAIHDKFLSEVQRLKSGFEAVVQFWIGTMSKLFDEQKLALCCALEFCQSRNSNTLSRRHIESALAASVGSGKLTLHDRSSDQAEEHPIAVDCDPQPFPDHNGDGAPVETPPPPPPPPDVVIHQQMASSMSAPQPDCRVEVDRLDWYERCWKLGECSGAVFRLFGQDFIVVQQHAGGEAQGSCDEYYTNPGYAWPTLDGYEFMGLPVAGSIAFRTTKELQAEVAAALQEGRYTIKHGDLSTLRTVLFPVSE